MGMRSGAVAVGSGILLSRLSGLLRDRAVAHVFGASGFADVFQTAMRAPNALQNLLGEQALSAAFIPGYTRLLAAGRKADAGRMAGAIFGLLLALAASLSLLGVCFAPAIVRVTLPGFLSDAGSSEGIDRFALVVKAVRWLFPMAGVLVLSAWCLGVLNSHRRFLLSYTAPVLWNAAIIAALVFTVRRSAGTGAAATAVTAASGEGLLIAACVGGLIGGLLQFLVQVPLALRLLAGFYPSFSLRAPGVREALRAFGPALAGRGVVQLSFWLEMFLSSFLALGGPGALGYAQRLYGLPVSLFGGAFAAAELPELAAQRGRDLPAGGALARVRASFAQMAFLIVPSLVGYLGLGFLLVGAVYRTGRFSLEDQWLVYCILASYTLGMLPSATSRLLQSAYFAVGDTAYPARVAALRLALLGLLAAALMVWLDRLPVAAVADLVMGATGTTTGATGATGEESGLRLGAAGLALASSLAAWVELAALLRGLDSRYGERSLPWPRVGTFFGLAGAALGAAVLVWRLVWRLPPIPAAALTLLGFGATYLGLALAARLPEAAALVRWLRHSQREGTNLPGGA